MILVTALALLALPIAATPDEVRLSELTVPVEWPSSMGSRLVEGANGQTYLSWVEEKGETARLRYSVLGEGGWRPAHTIAEGDNWMVNWADYPVLAVESDGSMAATWLERTGAEGTWDYGVRIAVSPNGEDWFGGASLHDNPAGPEHGFVSLVPMPSESGRGFGAVWLDSRAMGAAEGEEDGGHGAGAMALMFRRVSIGDEGIELGPELVLDSRTCDCCATTAVRGANGGLTVAYRDRAEDEVRDIAVLHLGDGVTFERNDPPADNWLIPGCPVNGPSLARQVKNMGMAWFTLDTGLMGKAEPKPAVKASFGTVAGGFGLPMRVDLGAPIGRAAAAMTLAGRMHVAWLERTPAPEGGWPEGAVPTARWMLRDMGTQSRRAPNLLAPLQLAEVPATRASGFASILWSRASKDGESGLLVAFTNLDADGVTHVETRLVSGL